MPNKILLKKSAVANRAPTTNDLSYGEVALNYLDGQLYYKNAADEIKSFKTGTQNLQGFDNRTDSTLTYDSSTRTVTLTQTGGVKYWYGGVQVTGAATITATHGTTAGSYFFYFNSTTPTITVTTTPWSLENDVCIVYVYWDGTKGVAWEERHASQRDPKYHAYLHSTRGTRKANVGLNISGYTLENGSSDANVRYALSSGTVNDEDIAVTVPAVTSGGPYMIWYRNGAAWTYSTTRTEPYEIGATYIKYDNAGTPTEATSGKYVNYWLFATTALLEANRTFLVVGQTLHNELGDALYEPFSNMSFTGFPVLEAAPIYRLTFAANSTFATTGKVSLEAVAAIDRDYAPTRFKVDYLDLGFTDSAGAPVSDTARLFCDDIASRFMPTFLGPVGVETALQPLLARNKTGLWSPPGNSTAVGALFGLGSFSDLGSPTARNVTAATYLGRMRRLGYRGNSATSSFAGVFSTAAQFTTGDATGPGGFFFVIRFGISDEATITDARQFIGVSSSVVTPTNVEPSTLTNCLGLAQLASNNTQFYVVYGGTTPQTPVALGATNFAPTVGNAYEFAIFAPQGSEGIMYWKATNLTNNTFVDGTVSGNSTVVPPDTVLLAPSAWRCNNATAQRCGLDIALIYLETDE